MKSRSNLFIVKALSKYGMANFTLVILEYTNEENVISCEQQYINRFKPEYYLNPTAGNSLGYKHTPESNIKIREAALGRKYSEEVKKLMSENRKGESNPFYGKKHTLDSLELIKFAAKNRTNPPVAVLEVEITDLDTKTTTVYNSIRKAAESINSDIKTILRREKLQIEKGINTSYRKRYIISIKRN
jgi:group I intron endonuclease